MAFQVVPIGAGGGMIPAHYAQRGTSPAEMLRFIMEPQQNAGQQNMMAAILQLLLAQQNRGEQARQFDLLLEESRGERETSMDRFRDELKAQRDMLTEQLAAQQEIAATTAGPQQTLAESQAKMQEMATASALDQWVNMRMKGWEEQVGTKLAPHERALETKRAKYLLTQQDAAQEAQRYVNTAMGQYAGMTVIGSPANLFEPTVENIVEKTRAKMKDNPIEGAEWLNVVSSMLYQPTYTKYLVGKNRETLSGLLNSQQAESVQHEARMMLDLSKERELIERERARLMGQGADVFAPLMGQIGLPWTPEAQTAMQTALEVRPEVSGDLYEALGIPLPEDLEKEQVFRMFGMPP